jgi:hypothetical protein
MAYNSAPLGPARAQIHPQEDNKMIFATTVSARTGRATEVAA